ncbi:MAG: tetratricopeptide repeat protein [Pyrinomonadaceae bacterium]|nr:tetratricopeptide repeat protein [Pyrinomonadaceae bacterium]
MHFRKSLSKSILTLSIIWVFLLSGFPVSGQGDFVTSSDISGGAAVYVFRTSRKAKKRNYVSRRKSRAKRTKKQKRTSRRKVVRQSKTVARRYRKKRRINKVTPQEFAKIDIQLARKTPQEASKIFAGAAEYFIEKDSDYQKAAGYLEEAIQLDPNNKDAKLALSELSVTLGNLAIDDTSLSRDLRFRKALSLFDQAVKNDPTNSLAYVGRGQVYDEQDENALARENYEKALEIDSSLSAVKAALGYIYYGEGRIEDSNILITEALAEGEDNEEIQYFLGLIRYKQGQDDAAAAALRKSISIDAENAEAHYYLGAVLNRKGEDQNAINSFERSVQLDPKFVNAWFDLGVVYYNNERYQDAINAFDKAVRDNANSTDELRRIYAESHANWAEAYRQMGDLDLAISKYRIAVGLITDDAELFSTFGFVLGSKNLWKDAVTNFEKAVDIQPDALNYANLGWAYLRSAQNNREVRYFDRERADLEKAATALQTAVQKDDSLIAALLNLGSVLNGLGRHNDALGPLQKANSMNRNWLPAMYELGVAYLESRRYSEAQNQFEKVIKKQKNFGHAYLGLGKAQHMSGKTKEARKTYERLKKFDAGLANRLETFFIQNSG